MAQKTQYQSMARKPGNSSGGAAILALAGIGAAAYFGLNAILDSPKASEQASRPALEQRIEPDHFKKVLPTWSGEYSGLSCWGMYDMSRGQDNGVSYDEFVLDLYKANKGQESLIAEDGSCSVMAFPDNGTAEKKDYRLFVPIYSGQ